MDRLVLASELIVTRELVSLLMSCEKGDEIIGGRASIVQIFA
jgi:hypothetical protein